MTRLTELHSELQQTKVDSLAVIAEARRLQGEMVAQLVRKGAYAAARGRLAERLRRGLAPLARAQNRRRTIAKLSALDERTLQDIGIQRSEIPAVVARLSGRPADGEGEGFLARLRSARARRATIRQLQSLPDRTLADIGIARSDIPLVVESLLAKSAAPTAAAAAPVTESPGAELRRRVEAAVRPLRQWQLSRVAAGQIARLDPDTLHDLGYVKGDVDWVPEVLAQRSLDRDADAESSRRVA